MPSHSFIFRRCTAFEMVHGPVHILGNRWAIGMRSFLWIQNLWFCNFNASWNWGVSWIALALSMLGQFIIFDYAISIECEIVSARRSAARTMWLAWTPVAPCMPPLRVKVLGRRWMIDNGASVIFSSINTKWSIKINDYPFSNDYQYFDYFLLSFFQ